MAKKKAMKTIQVVMYYDGEKHQIRERWFNTVETAAPFAAKYNTRPCPIEVAADAEIIEVVE